MKIGNVFKGDKVIWMVFFFLCLISIIEVFSASSGLTYKSGNFISPIVKHSATIFLGVIVTVITCHINCRVFKLMTPFLLLISIITLLMVLFIGEDVNGAQRQFSIMGISVQPSEIAKGTVVLTVAQILALMQGEDGADRNAFKYILWVTIPIAFLIMLENLSTAILLCAVVYLMMYIGRVPWKQLAYLMGVAVGAVVLIVALVMITGTTKEERAAKEKENMEMMAATQSVQSSTSTQASQSIQPSSQGVQTSSSSQTAADEANDKDKKEEESALEKLFHRADTWKARILKFTSGEEISPKEWDLDRDAQVAHANIAIASSNVVGVGPGNSVERDFLSQAFSDFIFAIVIEEMGIEGAIFVVLLYVMLLFRAIKIASRCENNFPAFLALGLALLLVVQATFNMLVAVGLAPVTGQPLPLISKGGSSTVINCAFIGIILSISRTAKKIQEAPIPAPEVYSDIDTDKLQANNATSTDADFDDAQANTVDFDDVQPRNEIKPEPITSDKDHE